MRSSTASRAVSTSSGVCTPSARAARQIEKPSRLGKTTSTIATS